MDVTHSRAASFHREVSFTATHGETNNATDRQYLGIYRKHFDVKAAQGNAGIAAGDACGDGNHLRRGFQGEQRKAAGSQTLVKHTYAEFSAS